MLAATVAAFVCFAILTAAGVGHLLHLRDFHGAIDAHHVWPARLTMPLASLVAALELGLGTAGIASTSLSDGVALHRLLLAAVAGIYACYAVYGLVLMRWRPGVPCACSHDADPIDAAVVVRAVVLAGLAGVALIQAPVAQDLSGREWTVIVLGSLAYGTALWALPAALRDPFTTIRADQARRLAS